MTIEFDNTLDDLFAFNLYRHQTSPTLRRQRQMTHFVIAALFPVSLIGFFLFFGGRLLSGTTVILVFIALAGALLLYFFYPDGLEQRVRTLTERLYNEGKNAAMKERKAITVSAGGITYLSGLSEGKIDWRLIEKVVTVEERLFLYTGSMSAIIVPKRAFVSDSEWNTFLATVHTYHTAATSNT